MARHRAPQTSVDRVSAVAAQILVWGPRINEWANMAHQHMPWLTNHWHMLIR